MKRDINAEATNGREILERNPEQDMMLSEINEFYQLYKSSDTLSNGLFDIISKAFHMGVSVGARITQER